MGMSQLIIGTAFGFIVAQVLFFGIRGSMGLAQRDQLRLRLRKLMPARGSVIVHGFVKYAAPVAVGAALITLGAWAVGDYFAAKSARGAAMASALDPSVGGAGNDQHGNAALTPPQPALAAADDVDEGTAGTPDPYKDADFKVRHKFHRGPPTLKEQLVQKEEARARAELLGQLKQHAQRSQYDCEVVDRAQKYLKAGLDVWGFTAWQSKYFPEEGYKGTTMPQCADIQNVAADSPHPSAQPASAVALATSQPAAAKQ
jgi:hypothetical protein